MGRDNLLATFRILKDNYRGGMLCFEIAELQGEGLIDAQRREAARSHIRSLMPGYISVMAWLCDNHQEVWDEIRTTSLVSTYRRAWIDHIIKELENEQTL